MAYSISKSKLSIVEDTMAAYLSRDVSIDTFFSDKMLVVQSIRKGIPLNLYLKIEQSTPFTEADWANYLSISTKTLQRYKNDKKHIFKSSHSEKILEITEVTNLGLEVFDTNEIFYNWLNTNSIALGNLSPAELLKDSYGKELVLDELNRINHGVFV